MNIIREDRLTNTQRLLLLADRDRIHRMHASLLGVPVERITYGERPYDPEYDIPARKWMRVDTPGEEPVYFGIEEDGTQ